MDNIVDEICWGKVLRRLFFWKKNNVVYYFFVFSFCGGIKINCNIIRLNLYRVLICIIK